MTMKLNTLQSVKGARPNKLRVGRGMGSGKGKTCGRGHKGQKSRSGGLPKIGFEGGQMPLHRRLPKSGFTARKSRFSAQVRLDQLNKLDASVIDSNVLKQAGLVAAFAKRIKVIASGQLSKSVTIKGLIPTKGAAAAITAAGGKVEA